MSEYRSSLDWSQQTPSQAMSKKGLNLR